MELTGKIKGANKKQPICNRLFFYFLTDFCICGILSAVVYMEVRKMLKKLNIKKPRISRLINKNLEYRGMVIGNDTPKEMKELMYSIRDCLLNESCKLPTGSYWEFELIEDKGIELGVYGNPSGGCFEGNYRTFIIKWKGKTMKVKFGLSDYCTEAFPDIIKTTFNVGVEDGEKKHHSLQHVVDKHLIITENKFIFSHSGEINVGNHGKGKNQDVRDFMEATKSGIVKDKLIILGEIDKKGKISFDNPQMLMLMENFILYALVRDEYREYRKKEIEQ